MKGPGEKGDNGISRETIVLSEDMLLSYSQEVFLLVDSGKDDANRILIFSTKSNLSIEIENWFIDGTFAVCPELFYQLYTINTFYKGKNLPLIYALLPNKEKITYEKFFNHL